MTGELFPKPLNNSDFECDRDYHDYLEYEELEEKKDK